MGCALLSGVWSGTSIYRSSTPDPAAGVVSTLTPGAGRAAAGAATAGATTGVTPALAAAAPTDTSPADAFLQHTPRF